MEQRDRSPYHYLLKEVIFLVDARDIDVNGLVKTYIRVRWVSLKHRTGWPSGNFNGVVLLVT